MANGDIRGADISSMVPTVQSRYQAPQIQTPQGLESEYGKLSQAQDYATNAVLKSLSTLGEIYDNHLDLERSNRWTDAQAQINDIFTEKTLNAQKFMSGQKNPDISFNNENGSVPAINTINKYMDSPIEKKGALVNLDNILESTKDDTKLHQGVVSYINSKRYGLMTNMIKGLTNIQISRGKDLLDSNYKNITDRAKNNVNITSGQIETNSTKDDWNEQNNIELWKEADQQVEKDHFQPHDDQVKNFIKRTNEPAKDRVYKLNKLRQDYMERKFVQDMALYGKIKPELVLERYNKGYYNMVGRKVFIDENGDIKYTKEEKLILDPKNIHKALSSLISETKVKKLANKKSLHFEILTSLATQSDSTNNRFKATYTKRNDEGLYVPDYTQIGRDHPELSDPNNKDRTELQKIVTKAYKYKASTSGKSPLPKNIGAFYNEYSRWRLTETINDAETIGADPRDLVDLTDVDKKYPDFYDNIKKIDVFFDQLISTRPDRLAEISLNELQDGIAHAKGNLPPHAELGQPWQSYISTLEAYLNKKSGDVSGTIMQETGIFFNLEKPITNEELEVLNQQNVIFNGKSWTPSKEQMDSWGSMIKPQTKGGQLQFSFDNTDNRIDTVLATKERIIGYFEDRKKGEKIWEDTKRYWRSQGGDLRVASILYDYWEGPDSIRDSTKVTLIQGLNREETNKNKILEDEARKWDRNRDTYLDKLEVIGLKDAHMQMHY